MPHINGVTNSVLRVIEQLRPLGHEFHIITPIAGEDHYDDVPVERLTALPLPGYPQVSISLAGTRSITSALEQSRPDVIHLASPFVVGPPAIRAASRMGIPVVSIFQTDVAGFAAHYGFKAAENWAWRRLLRIHNACDRTLVPSSPTMNSLKVRGFERLSLWQRGVDTERFNPAHRDEQLHSTWAGDGRTVVGYLGRVAPEKQTEHLSALADLDNVQLVVIGDGPSRAALERRIPNAHFMGFLGGIDLSRATASLDVMVHTGPHETFCQSIQEALASGVPAIAPASGGPIDLIDPSRTGWLYTPDDLNGLRNHVRDLAGDDVKRRAMGIAARASVEHRTWPLVMGQLVRHYEQAIGTTTSTKRKKVA